MAGHYYPGAAARRPVPRRRQLSKRVIRNRRLALGLLILLLLGGIWWGWHRSQRNQGAAAGASPQAVAGQHRFSVLLVGADERPDDPGRSDSLLLASVDLDRKQVGLVSLERDLLLNIPGHGYDKLNAAYAFGKEQLAQDTIQGLLGLPIDHHVVINMQGFQEIIGILDGVEIDVEKDMVYDDPYDTPPLHINLQKGLQVLTPEQALQYVRFRHDAESNNGRMRRQQQMIRAVVKAALQPGNLPKLPRLIPAAFRAVRTDFGLSDWVSLASLAKGWSADSIQGQGVLTGTDYWRDGVSYQKPDLVDLRAKAYRLLTGGEPPADFLARAQQDQAAYLAGLPAPESAPTAPAPAPGPAPAPALAPKPGGTTPGPQRLDVVLYDASGKSQAAGAGNKLGAAGFQVAQVITAKQVSSVTTIGLRTQAPGVKERLQALFPKARLTMLPASKDAQAPVEIVLGSDYSP